MKVIRALIKRNVRLFFRDKGMFFTSLITPMILLVLYITFLGNVYRDSFSANLPKGLPIPADLVDAIVAGLLASSILSVSCVTVAFCSNFLMVQDRALGMAMDFGVSPVRTACLSAGYYAATLISTLLICFAGLLMCLAFQAYSGWYMSVLDVFCLLADVVLLVLFATALSSVVNAFLSTQGQISAVGTIVSAGYGFLCGAYMPISSFAPGLQRVLSFLPGTYGTVLVRRHCMLGALKEIQAAGVPEEAVNEMMNAFDVNIRFFESSVGTAEMYLILAGATAALLIAFVAITAARRRAA